MVSASAVLLSSSRPRLSCLVMTAVFTHRLARISCRALVQGYTWGIGPNIRGFLVRCPIFAIRTSVAEVFQGLESCGLLVGETGPPP